MSSHIRLEAGDALTFVHEAPMDGQAYVRMNGEWCVLKPSPPVLVTAPTITGSGKIGTEHYCDAGGWDNDPTFQYQWKKMQAGNPAVLPGATTRIYVPTNQDSNKEIFCTVMATNAYGSVIADSNMIAVLPPVAEARPT